MDATEILEFLRVQLETAFWCDREGRPASFRTAELNPSLGDWPTRSEFETALETLRLRRRTFLGPGERKVRPLGRLLVCHVHESISSGESEAETSGFFDVHDRPPWDTWIWQCRGVEEQSVTLVSWVPRDLEETVSRGIAVNPYECISWLADAPSTRELRALQDAEIRQAG
jgi:hypothetical protein